MGGAEEGEVEFLGTQRSGKNRRNIVGAGARRMDF